MQPRCLPPSKASAETTAEFELVLTTAAQVSINTAGKAVPRVVSLASQLLSQAVVSGTTMSLLVRPGKRTNVPGFNEEVEIVDLPSTAVVARAIVELYLVHFYLAVDQISSEESDFRLLWWDWHEINERIWSLEKIGSLHPNLSQMKQSRARLRTIVSGHRLFPKLPAKLKREFEGGHSPTDAVLVSKAKIAQRSGIHPDQFRLTYKSLSQHAHAQPVAVSSMLKLSSIHPELTVHFDSVLRDATSYLLFLVRDFCRLMPEAQKFITPQFQLVELLWSAVRAEDLSKAVSP